METLKKENFDQKVVANKTIYSLTRDFSEAKRKLNNMEKQSLAWKSLYETNNSKL